MGPTDAAAPARKPASKRNSFISATRRAIGFASSRDRKENQEPQDKKTRKKQSSSGQPRSEKARDDAGSGRGVGSGQEAPRMAGAAAGPSSANGNGIPAFPQMKLGVLPDIDRPETPPAIHAPSPPAEQQPASSPPAEQQPASSPPAEQKPASSLQAEQKPAPSPPAEQQPAPSPPAEQTPASVTPSPTLTVTPLGAHLLRTLPEPPAQLHPRSSLRPGAPTLHSPTAPQHDAHAAIWAEIHARQFSHAAAPSTRQIADAESPGPIARFLPPLSGSVISLPITPTSPLTPLGDLPVRRRTTAFSNRTKEQAVKSTPGGFVLTEPIRLFGEHDAQLYTFHGAASAGSGRREIVVLKTDKTLSFAQLFPDLKGTVIGGLECRHLQLSYNEKASPTRKAGLWLDTTLGLDLEGLKEIGDVLRGIFGQTPVDARFQACLGRGLKEWTAPRSIEEMRLESVMRGIAAPCGELVTFTSVAVNIDVNRAPAQNPTGVASPNTEPKYTCQFFYAGGLRLRIPGKITPLLGTYTLDNKGDGYNLRFELHDDHWRTAFGISGLDLVDVLFSASIPKSLKTDEISLYVKAVLGEKVTKARLQGIYNHPDDWKLSGSLLNLSLNGLLEMYNTLFKTTLDPFPHEVSFGQLAVDVTPTGFVLSGNTVVEKLEVATATIALSKRGINISGDVPDAPLMKGVIIKNATLDAWISRSDVTGTRKETLLVSGTITVGKKLNSAAKVYYEKDPDGETVWTAYGDLSDGAAPLTLAHLDPGLSGSDLDLCLEDVCLIASNTKFPRTPIPTSKFSYPVSSGLQIHATLDSLPQLSKAANVPVTRLFLSAVYEPDVETLALKLTTATPRNLQLGHGINSGPFEVTITALPKPRLALSAKCYIVVAGKPGPLTAQLQLDVGIVKADGYASLEDWSDPLGLCPALTVQNLGLDVGIVYAGGIYPNTLALTGKMKIGATMADMKFMASEDPADELVVIAVQNLGLQELVALAGAVLDQKLPPPPNFIDFNNFNLYMSTGANIGRDYYPPGMSFKGNATVFGTTAAVDVEVNRNKELVSVKGSVDPFRLGPLTVKGMSGRNGARLDLQLTGRDQHALVDGEVDLWDVKTELRLSMALRPPALSFTTKLKFTSHLDFELTAALDHVTNFQDLGNAEGTVHAEFNQDILEYLAGCANTFFLALQHLVDAGLDAFNTSLTLAENSLRLSIAKCQATVDARHATWEKKRMRTLSSYALAQKYAATQKKRHCTNVDVAKARFDGMIQRVIQELEAAQEKQALELAKAEAAVREVKSWNDDFVAHRLEKLHNAEDAMMRAFGDAEATLEDARRYVQAAEDELSKSSGDLEDAQAQLAVAPWDEAIPLALELAELEAATAAKLAAYELAKAILTAAEDIVAGPAYMVAKTTLDDARAALREAHTIVDRRFDGALKMLAAVDAAQSNTVHAAEAALRVAKMASDECHLWQAAKRALAASDELEGELVGAAAAAVEALQNCAEKVGYETAVLALAVARAGCVEIGVARMAVEAVRGAEEEVRRVGEWMRSSVSNVLVVEGVTVEGRLEGLARGELQAAVKYKLIGKENTVRFTWGGGEKEKGEGFVKRLLGEVWKHAKEGLPLP